jgi:hypothetical protein
MTATRRVNILASTVLLLSMAGAMSALHSIDRLGREALSQESLYISSPKVLRRLSLGYSGFLADIYWTRAVQYFGTQHHKGASDFRLLAPLLEVTTALDPRLFPAYEFGANFLAPQPPAGAGLPGSALSLMKFGIEHNPDEWRLYYNLGFLYYTELKDYAGAERAFSHGSQLQHTSPFMKILAAQMAQHAGEFDTARMLWLTTYQTTKDPNIRQNALNHLTALRVDEDVTQLEELTAKYRQQTGRAPGSILELQQAGLLHVSPVDPKGNPYKITSDGRIEVQDPEILHYITKGLPPGVKVP